MTDRVGRQVGNYRLISLLGQGGFAEVYLGEHIYLRSKAAITHHSRNELGKRGIFWHTEEHERGTVDNERAHR